MAGRWGIRTSDNSTGARLSVHWALTQASGWPATSPSRSSPSIGQTSSRRSLLSSLTTVKQRANCSIKRWITSCFLALQHNSWPYDLSIKWGLQPSTQHGARPPILLYGFISAAKHTAAHCVPPPNLSSDGYVSQWFHPKARPIFSGLIQNMCFPDMKYKAQTIFLVDGKSTKVELIFTLKTPIYIYISF
jgi:hypothetical protein